METEAAVEPRSDQVDKILSRYIIVTTGSGRLRRGRREVPYAIKVLMMMINHREYI